MRLSPFSSELKVLILAPERMQGPETNKVEQMKYLLALLKGAECKETISVISLL